LHFKIDLAKDCGDFIKFRRGLPLTPLQQTCLAIHYFASPAFQSQAGLMAGVKKSCAHQTIHRVLRAICQRSHEHISFPTRSQMVDTSEFF